MSNYDLSWSDLAFGSKKCLRELDAIFIAAPREISKKRLTQLIKEHLPSGNIIIGCAKELYIDGFNNQPQFKTLQIDSSDKLIDKVNKSASHNKITVLHYNQSDFIHIVEKVKFRLVLLVNGSWYNSFHTRPEYYKLVSRNIDFKFISPFVDENEAKQYANNFDVKTENTDELLSETQMMAIANQTASNSFDNAHQTGVAVGKKIGDKYKLITTAYNKGVPYPTFAWHFGALREKHLSSPGDLNYYDTVHAEVMLIMNAGQNKINLAGTTLFINLLPCPTCARMLCESSISEIVYTLDHSEGYAVALLEKANKKVTRLIDVDKMLKNGG
ncbi:MAG: dCMP deaminase [Patescibacteria group bacterium]|nr:dCMP deaminase [Patescibacteria group bacterium]